MMLDENSTKIWKIISELKGNFYLCGDANRFVSDVQKALIQIFSKHGQLSEEEGKKYLEEEPLAGEVYLNIGRYGDLSGNFVSVKGKIEEATTGDESFGGRTWSKEVYESLNSWDMQFYMKVDMLLDDKLKIPLAEQEAFKKKYEISQGHWTLEWCHPSPMPWHTYEELPIIKEIEEPEK